MRDYVHEHFAKHPRDKDSWPRARPAIVCRDGYSYSVQASVFTYCSPREDNAPRYTAVEVWGIRRNGLWHGREPEGWVPVETVNRRIRRHGGVAD